MKLPPLPHLADDTKQNPVLLRMVSPRFKSMKIKNRQTVYPKGTIVIERYHLRQEHGGRRRFTISHESAHYVMIERSHASFHREFDNERDYTHRRF